MSVPMMLVAALASAGAVPAPGAVPTLAVRHEGSWVTWWRGDRAPARWSAPDARVLRAVQWRPGSPGVAIGELSLAGTGMGWRVRVILGRFDPARLAMQLDYRPDRLRRPDRWDVADASSSAVLAINAGQFDERGPWGWLVQDGVERQAPGDGPLSAAVVQDRRGRLRFVGADGIARVRAAGGIRFAIQSYPVVLHGDGDVPEVLRAPGRGVNLTHRDARAALCELRDGQWLAMLTRYEGLGGTLEALPFGLTTPEMAALAGALGCLRAVLLDGGMSGQLALGEPNGEMTRWNGLRRVPAGVVAVPRSERTGGR